MKLTGNTIQTSPINEPISRAGLVRLRPQFSYRILLNDLIRVVNYFSPLRKLSLWRLKRILRHRLRYRNSISWMVVLSDSSKPGDACATRIIENLQSCWQQHVSPKENPNATGSRATEKRPGERYLKKIWIPSLQITLLPNKTAVVCSIYSKSEFKIHKKSSVFDLTGWGNEINSFDCEETILRRAVFSICMQL